MAIRSPHLCLTSDVGFTGEKCDIPLLGLSLQPKNDKSSSDGLIAVIAISIILLIASLALLVHYRRRLSKLKHELYVSYSASEGAPDKRHFDNPVYIQSTLALTKNTRNIRNELNNASNAGGLDSRSPKSNIQKAKSYENGSRMDTCGTTAGAPEAESTCVYNEVEERPQSGDHDNPNIYHSIEDIKSLGLKKEPFYEEVKRRSVRGLQSKLTSVA